MRSESERCHEWQMVAETVAVDRAEEVASWLCAAIFLVGFGEEWGIVDVATSRFLYNRRANKDVVQAAPGSLVTVGAFGPMPAAGIGRQVHKAVGEYGVHGLLATVHVKIASHDNHGIVRHLVIY